MSVGSCMFSQENNNSDSEHLEPVCHRTKAISFPDRTFRNIRASKSVDRRICTSQSSPITGFRGSKIVKYSVGSPPFFSQSERREGFFTRPASKRAATSFPMRVKRRRKEAVRKRKREKKEPFVNLITTQCSQVPVWLKLESVLGWNAKLMSVVHQGY